MLYDESWIDNGLIKNPLDILLNDFLQSDYHMLRPINFVKSSF